ncbi:hypothetical protein P3T23_003081 [Paraburkholderia sp. GAS448]|jgi:hypothetical protein|uniref:DUF4148 domain-containing protein n=1 Tax=Paraburkholderia sp. GAS448 TaxID=3035136 RepID=UPI003D2344C1
MKSHIKAVALALVFAAPVVSFAQSNGPLTRQQVQDEIVQLEKAGFNPANANTVDFPANVPTGQAAVAGQDSGYGPTVGGSSQAGRPASTSGIKPVFFGQ